MGKKVKCVDNSGVNGTLVIGNIYEVMSINFDGNYKLSGLAGSYREDRFIDVDEDEEPIIAPIGSIVTCIEPPGYNNQDLIAGQDYEVIGYHPTSPDNYRLKGIATCYMASRFKLKSKAPAPAIMAKPNASIDMEEERCWMMMRPHRGPNDCPCGILKEKCTYHR